MREEDKIPKDRLNYKRIFFIRLTFKQLNTFWRWLWGG